MHDLAAFSSADQPARMVLYAGEGIGGLRRDYESGSATIGVWNSEVSPIWTG